jgi:hypothetical protein
MRLRPLSEAECYARCYGARQSEQFSQVRLIPKPSPRSTIRGEDLRMLFEQRLEERGMEAA